MKNIFYLFQEHVILGIRIQDPDLDEKNFRQRPESSDSTRSNPATLKKKQEPSACSDLSQLNNLNNI